MEYADAARVVGNPAWRIMFIHLLPNCAAADHRRRRRLAMGYALLTMSALSFIGLGIQPPQSEWGSMTARGRAVHRHRRMVAVPVPRPRHRR